MHDRRVSPHLRLVRHLEDFDMMTKTIELTRNEALFIDDNITLMTEERGLNVGTMRNVAPSATIPVPLDFVEKIGMAILMTLDKDNEVYSIEVSIGELLVIRELCTSFVKVGEEPVGFNLKLKVYRALLQDEYKERKA